MLKRLVPFFMISSLGGSATKWLSGQLNRHPKIVCFHALREAFPDESGGDTQTPIAVADTMLRLHEMTGASKSIGNVHGFTGASCKQAILAKGGGFGVIIRNPVFRINSLFSHHAEITLGHEQKQDDLYHELIDSGKVNPEARGLPVNWTPEGERSFEEEFAIWCLRTFLADIDYTTYCLREDLIAFENMTVDPNYLTNKLTAVIGPEMEKFDKYADDGWSKRSNVHSRKSYTSHAEIFENWPLRFREVFLLAVEKLNASSVLTMYRDFGYDLGDIIPE